MPVDDLLSFWQQESTEAGEVEEKEREKPLASRQSSDLGQLPLRKSAPNSGEGGEPPSSSASAPSQSREQGFSGMLTPPQGLQGAETPVPAFQPYSTEDPVASLEASSLGDDTILPFPRLSAAFSASASYQQQESGTSPDRSPEQPGHTPAQGPSGSLELSGSDRLSGTQGLSGSEGLPGSEGPTGSQSLSGADFPAPSPASRPSSNTPSPPERRAQALPSPFLPGSPALPLERAPTENCNATLPPTLRLKTPGPKLSPSGGVPASSASKSDPSRSPASAQAADRPVLRGIASASPGSEGSGAPGGERAGPNLGETLLVEDIQAVSPPGQNWGSLKSPKPALPLGTVLKQRYRLEERIGAGGTSVVYRATDLSDLSPVAIKVVNLRGNDEELAARFRREMELTVGFVHPNVLRVFGMDRDGDIDFVVMELLSGSDLRTLLGKPLPPAVALRIVTHTAAALEYIHERGVFHRDIKPANLFQTTRGIIKLMDFGFAKGAASTSMTMAGTIIGTPDYISPEQVNGEHKVGAASDLYSLGVVAYQLLTGQLPFKHPQLMHLLMMHVKEPPRAMRELNPEIPQEFDDLVLRLLAKHPADRLADAGELRQELGKLWKLVLPQARGL